MPMDLTTIPALAGVEPVAVGDRLVGLVADLQVLRRSEVPDAERDTGSRRGDTDRHDHRQEVEGPREDLHRGSRSGSRPKAERSPFTARAASAALKPSIMPSLGTLRILCGINEKGGRENPPALLRGWPDSRSAGAACRPQALPHARLPTRSDGRGRCAQCLRKKR